MELENTSIRLKKIMQEKNLRQVDLLEMVKPFCEKYDVKINKSDISQYLSGKVKPGQEKLSMLGMALGVTESWLMGYDSQKEKPHYVETLTLSKKEITLLENYNKLNDLGKEKLVEYSNDLIETPKYLTTTFDEITATKDNVIELNNPNNVNINEKFIPYTSLDEAGTTIAAHDDDLTHEEKERADKILLDYINNERLKEFNKKHNNK
jgi:transcriptional regulator with XRE-family HTH domain